MYKILFLLFNFFLFFYRSWGNHQDKECWAGQQDGGAEGEKLSGWDMWVEASAIWNHKTKFGSLFGIFISNFSTPVLRIVSVQLEIDKLASVAQSEKDYANISGVWQLICNVMLSKLKITESNVWRHQLCRNTWRAWWPEFRTKVMKTPNWVSHSYQGGEMRGLQCCWTQEINLIPTFFFLFFFCQCLKLCLIRMK